MTVIEKRFAGKLRELKPLVKRIPPNRVKLIVNEVFSIDFFEPENPQPFVYVDSQSLLWHIRPERRKGTEKRYWVMYKTINGRRFKKYLAAQGELTLEKIQDAITAVWDDVYPEPPDPN